MTTTNDSTVTFTASCLCKANFFTAEIAKSKLPLSGHICHCDSCRYVSGALCTAGADWPTPRENVDVSNLKAFAFSPKVDLLFCPTCSSKMFWSDSQDKSSPLGVLTGVLSNSPGNLINFVNQIYVDDTLDGGASVWLRHLNSDGSETKRFKFGSRGPRAEAIPEDWPDMSKLVGYEDKREDIVPIRCKCEGVNLSLHRGKYANIRADDLPPVVDPHTGKYLASTCGCDSCRLQGGIEYFNWTFAETKNLCFNNGGKSFTEQWVDLIESINLKESTVGSLGYYNSSPGVYRFFCNTCSACIFYACDERPNLIDIAVGVLHASDGARAEGLLSWAYGARLSYSEDGDGGWRQELFERVQNNAEQYRLVRKYPKNWLRLQKDEENVKEV